MRPVPLTVTLALCALSATLVSADEGEPPHRDLALAVKALEARVATLEAQNKALAEGVLQLDDETGKQKAEIGSLAKMATQNTAMALRVICDIIPMAVSGGSNTANTIAEKFRPQLDRAILESQKMEDHVATGRR